MFHRHAVACFFASQARECGRVILTLQSLTYYLTKPSRVLLPMQGSAPEPGHRVYVYLSETNKGGKALNETKTNSSTARVEL